MRSKDNRKLLEERLLKQSGDIAFIIDFDFWIDKVLESGRFFSGDNTIIEGGMAGKCHLNSIETYMENSDLKVCTGFSMNNKKWHRHTWCVDSNGIIHECTPIKREMYYGTILDEEDTRKLRSEWDFQYAEEMKSVIVKDEVLRKSLREAEDCKYFISRCINDDCEINSEIENRRKRDIDCDEWTSLKLHLYKFKENFFRNIGKSPLDNSLTDYKKDALNYLERSYPFCFGIDLREKEELFYISGIELELEFYCRALGASTEQIQEIRTLLKQTKLDTPKCNKKVTRGLKQNPVREIVDFDNIGGSSKEPYMVDNLYGALTKIDDKHVENFIEYLLVKDYENNPEFVFKGTNIDKDDNGKLYVAKGIHRVITAKVLRLIKKYLQEEQAIDSIKFESTVSRIKLKDETEVSQDIEL